ncbi:HEPN domain-containing protein [Chryseobacterium sp. 2TAF14]|uniref:HEPN domain-containing protein n=1 Tax=Chryseobacterium sp. 2TAF14 TaxID=3233007 RepID=UPI003F8DF4ED
MAKSRKLKQLETRIGFLEREILPAARTDGNYTKKEKDLIKSFILLCHAEIEFFIEDIAKEKIQVSLRNWNSTRNKSNCLKSVLAFIGNEINFDNDSNGKILTHRMNRIVAHYFSSVIDKNHGIKEANILKVLLPLGIELHEIDVTWLSTMNSFGATRGLFAHSSNRVHSAIDRNTVLNQIKTQILPELEVIDSLVKKLK